MYRAGAPTPSASHTDVALRCVGPMLRPVSVARALTGRGLGLRKAHAALNRLAEGKRVVVRLRGSGDPAELRRELAELNVAVEPDAVEEALG
jgi:hypothetical protein